MKKLLLFSVSLYLYIFMSFLSSSPAFAQTCQACIEPGTYSCNVTAPCPGGYTCPAVNGTFTCPGVSALCPGVTTLSCTAATPTPPPPTNICKACYDSVNGYCVVSASPSCSSGSTCPATNFTASCPAGVTTFCPTETTLACITPPPTVTATGSPAPTVSVQICPASFGSMGIMTGLGCIPTQLDSLIKWVLRFIAGIVGGIALLLIFYGGIMFVTAGGDPKGVEEAKGIITAAVSGLLLIMFSVLILKIIGVDILGIPAITGTGTGGITTP